MSKDKSIFCFGFGYTAHHLADHLAPLGWRIIGTTRSEDKAAAMVARGLDARIWQGDIAPANWLDGVNAILVSPSPDDDGCPALRAAKEAIVTHRDHLDWIGYLSSNSIYGDHGGQWVDEETPPNPQTTRAKRRAKAEAGWTEFAEAHHLPLTIFRLPGIYGPGRSAFDSIRAGKARRTFKEGHVVNRAHVEDIVAALAASLSSGAEHRIYNIVDDEPAPSHAVTDYACELLGVASPPLLSIDDADISDLVRSYYSECKRVSNQRMKDALQVTLKYPTYREGLKAILANEGGGRETRS